MVVINIPDDYQVEYLPQAAKYKLPSGLGSYTYMIQHLNGSVNVTKMLKLNRAIYSPEEAKMLRQLFINIVEKEDDKIVLVKKE